MNICRLHPRRLVFHQQASAKWWKIAGKLLFPLQKIFIVEDYVPLVNKKSKDIQGAILDLVLEAEERGLLPLVKGEPILPEICMNE